MLRNRQHHNHTYVKLRWRQRWLYDRVHRQNIKNNAKEKMIDIGKIHHHTFISSSIVCHIDINYIFLVSTKPWEFSNYWTVKDRTIRFFGLLTRLILYVHKNIHTERDTHLHIDIHKQTNIYTHIHHYFSTCTTNSLYMYKLLMVLSPNRTRLT